MKQDSIFSYVKWKNNSEGVYLNEQCSSNVKEAPNRKRTKCSAIVKVTKWNVTYFRYGFFLLDGQILNVADKFHKCKNNRVIYFLLFNFCCNCLFFEVSTNDIFHFLISNLCFLIFVNGAPWRTGKYIRGSAMTKRFKSTVLDSKLGTWQFLVNYYKNQMQLQCSWNAKQEMKVLFIAKRYGGEIGFIYFTVRS